MHFSITWISFFLYLLICTEGKDPEPPEPLDPIEPQNVSRQHRYVSGQYFFEYLVVVSLKKTRDGSSYEPQITYQFPKVSLTMLDTVMIVVVVPIEINPPAKKRRGEWLIYTSNNFQTAMVSGQVCTLCRSISTNVWDTFIVFELKQLKS